MRQEPVFDLHPKWGPLRSLFDDYHSLNNVKRGVLSWAAECVQVCREPYQCADSGYEWCYMTECQD